MNSNKYLMIAVCALLISSSMAVACPWSWVKDKVSSMLLSYKRRDIPRPHLIEHQMMELDGKEFEEFRYDTSRDNDAMKALRKKLHISGIYLSNESDLDTYKKYFQKISVPKQYVESGFDVNLNNSISGCMGRLFTEMIDRDFVMFSGTPEEYAWTQLLWELEASLPDVLNNDSIGDGFIDVVDAMFPQNKMSKMALRYIPFWKYYTLRYKNSEGLSAAHVRTDIYFRKDLYEDRLLRQIPDRDLKVN